MPTVIKQTKGDTCKDATKQWAAEKDGRTVNYQSINLLTKKEEQELNQILE